MNGINCKVSSSMALFLSGLGAGVALTLLLAPRSGAETRRLIGKKVGAGKGWAKHKASAAEAYAKERGEELRGRAEEVAEVMTARL